jgi:hypothetical protein
MTLCIRNTLTLPPAIDGIWTSDEPSVVEIVGNEIAKGLSAGNAKITYTDTVAGGSCSEDIDITVYDFPVVSETSGRSVVCKGSTIALSNGTSGGVWKTNNANITLDNPNANPVTVRGVTEGKSFVSYTVSDHGCETTATFRLKVTSEIPTQPKILIGF